MMLFRSRNVYSSVRVRDYEFEQRPRRCIYKMIPAKYQRLVLSLHGAGLNSSPSIFKRSAAIRGGGSLWASAPHRPTQSMVVSLFVAPLIHRETPSDFLALVDFHACY